MQVATGHNFPSHAHSSTLPSSMCNSVGAALTQINLLPETVATTTGSNSTWTTTHALCDTTDTVHMPKKRCNKHQTDSFGLRKPQILSKSETGYTMEHNVTHLHVYPLGERKNHVFYFVGNSVFYCGESRQILSLAGPNLKSQ